MAVPRQKQVFINAIMFIYDVKNTERNNNKVIERFGFRTVMFDLKGVQNLLVFQISISEFFAKASDKGLDYHVR